jgi:hypothetical protein
MNPLAIALQGVGYAALVLGLQGFATVESDQVVFGGAVPEQRKPELRELILAEDELLVLLVTSFTPMLR